MLFNEPKLLKSSGSRYRRTGNLVSVLFNEPKLLKSPTRTPERRTRVRVSVLFNEPKLLKSNCVGTRNPPPAVSVLFNEPKLLKLQPRCWTSGRMTVSVLFNEPKLLKCCTASESVSPNVSFSALQRAEIAEIAPQAALHRLRPWFQCSSTSRNC